MDWLGIVILIFVPLVIWWGFWLQHRINQENDAYDNDDCDCDCHREFDNYCCCEECEEDAEEDAQIGWWLTDGWSAGNGKPGF